MIIYTPLLFTHYCYTLFQVLHEAEEKQLQSHLNLSAADADEFKWLCFDIYSARDENEEALNYLDLTKEAAEWGKQAGLVPSGIYLFLTYMSELNIKNCPIARGM